MTWSWDPVAQEVRDDQCDISNLVMEFDFANTHHGLRGMLFKRVRVMKQGDASKEISKASQLSVL